MLTKCRLAKGRLFRPVPQMPAIHVGQSLKGVDVVIGYLLPSDKRAKGPLVGTLVTIMIDQAIL